MGISTLSPEDRASAGRGRIRTRSARQSHEHRRDAWPHNRRGENAKGGRVCLRAGGSAVRIPAVKGSAASERDPTAGRLHDAIGRARLPHHRIRRIRLFTVSMRRDIFDDCPDVMYSPSVSRASGLIDKSPSNRLEANRRNSCDISIKIDLASSLIVVMNNMHLLNVRDFVFIVS